MNVKNEDRKTIPKASTVQTQSLFITPMRHSRKCARLPPNVGAK